MAEQIASQCENTNFIVIVIINRLLRLELDESISDCECIGVISVKDENNLFS